MNNATTQAGYGPCSDSPLGYIGWDIWTPLEEAIWDRFPVAGLVEAVEDDSDLYFTDAEPVPADRLYSRNGATYDGRVAYYRDLIRAGEDIGPSWVFRFADLLIVVDGNHKAHARIAEGQAVIPCKIHDLNGRSPAADRDARDTEGATQ